MRRRPSRLVSAYKLHTGYFRIEAAMNRKTWGFTSFGVGVVLAVFFGILSANSSGANSTGYLVAAIACGLAALAGLIVGLTTK